MNDHEERDQKLRVKAIAAARMMVEGRKQVEIAAALGVSQPSVSRLLNHARDKGWLVSRLALRRAKIDSEDWEGAEAEFFSDPALQAALERLSPNGKCRLIVVDGDMEQFLQGAGARLRDVFEASRCLGTMWGRTLHKAIDYMTRSERVADSRPRARKEIRFIPLCGDPLYIVNLGHFDHSASQLSARVDEFFNGRRLDSASLAGVPAYVSTREAWAPALHKSGRKPSPPAGRGSAVQGKNDHDVIRGFFSQTPGYKEIFIDPRTVNQVDTIVTGIGVISLFDGGKYLAGNFLDERIKQDRIPAKKLHDVVLGDIGGWLIGRKTNDDQANQVVRHLNRGWLGATKDDYLGCVERAAREKANGVVVVAAGAEKRDLAFALVEEAMVSQLIVDRELAKSMYEALPAQP